MRSRSLDYLSKNRESCSSVLDHLPLESQRRSVSTLFVKEFQRKTQRKCSGSSIPRFVQFFVVFCRGRQWLTLRAIDNRVSYRTIVAIHCPITRSRWLVPKLMHLNSLLFSPLSSTSSRPRYSVSQRWEELSQKKC